MLKKDATDRLFTTFYPHKVNHFYYVFFSLNSSSVVGWFVTGIVCIS